MADNTPTISEATTEHLQTALSEMRRDLKRARGIRRDAIARNIERIEAELNSRKHQCTDNGYGVCAECRRILDFGTTTLELTYGQWTEMPLWMSNMIRPYGELVTRSKDGLYRISLPNYVAREITDKMQHSLAA